MNVKAVDHLTIVWAFIYHIKGSSTHLSTLNEDPNKIDL